MVNAIDKCRYSFVFKRICLAITMHRGIEYRICLKSQTMVKPWVYVLHLYRAIWQCLDVRLHTNRAISSFAILIRVKDEIWSWISKYAIVYHSVFIRYVFPHAISAKEWVGEHPIFDDSGSRHNRVRDYHTILRCENIVGRFFVDTIRYYDVLRLFLARNKRHARHKSGYDDRYAFHTDNVFVR